MKTEYIKIWSREYTVQYSECALRATGPDVKNHLPSVLKSFMITEDGNQSYYASLEEWSQYNKNLAEIFNSKSLLKRNVRNFHKYGKEYVRTSKLIGSLEFSKLSNHALADKYLVYIKILNIYSAYLWTGYSLNELSAEKGKQLLETKKLDKKILDLVLPMLFSPIERTSILKLQDYLGKLKNQGRRLSNDLLKEILKDYAWVPCLDLHNDPWRQKDLLDFFQHLHVGKGTTISFNKATKLAGLNNQEISFFKLVRQLAYIKDMRDEYRRKGVYDILPLFDEIGKRIGLSRKKVAQMTNNEIKFSLLKGRMNLRQIKLRDKGFVFFWKDKDLVISTKKKDLEFYRRRIKNIEQGKQIFGLSASNGKVTGVAKIILNVSDLRKIKPRDILVALTTHPDFVPSMHKASAIVTDEGGLTSHAAIVSRELGIPCIVGTKVATKVLKDGDMVEVDANKGIVRKLTK